MAGKYVDRFFQRFRELVEQEGQVKVDYGVVQELLVGQRLVVVRRHAVTLKLTKPENGDNLILRTDIFITDIFVLKQLSFG